MATPPALELDTLAPEHPVINLRSKMWPEKKSYELRYESELSMEDIARLATLTKQAEPLVDATDLDPMRGRLLDEWLDEAMGIIFYTDLELDVRKSMGAGHKWLIVEFFGETCMDRSGSMEAAMKETPTETPTAIPTTITNLPTGATS